eukprot:g3126.t1
MSSTTSTYLFVASLHAQLDPIAAQFLCEQFQQLLLFRVPVSKYAFEAERADHAAPCCSRRRSAFCQEEHL